MQQKIFQIISAFFCFILYMPIAFAAASYNAGNIKAGQKWTLQALDELFYHADGKSGSVKFECWLESFNPNDKNRSIAILRSDKNFGPNLQHHEALHKGHNGPYTWRLMDFGAKEGIISVSLYKGGESDNKANIKCNTVL